LSRFDSEQLLIFKPSGWEVEDQTLGTVEKFVGSSAGVDLKFQGRARKKHGFLVWKLD